jgi:hypothetical protein
MMRSWKLPDGRILVEGEVSSVMQPWDAPDGTRIENSRAYHLLNSSGALEHTYQGLGGSVQEHLYELAYHVVGDRLLCFYADWCDGELSSTVQEELRGLVPTEPSNAPNLQTALRADAEKRRREEEEEKRRHLERLRSFERSLVRRLAGVSFPIRGPRDRHSTRARRLSLAGFDLSLLGKVSLS